MRLRLYPKNRNAIIVWLLILLTSFLLLSCGARKAEKNRNSEQLNSVAKESTATEKTADLNVKTESTTKVDDKNEIVTEESIFEPSDPTKPASVIDSNGNKTILNNVKKTVKKTTQKNNTKTDNSVVSKMELTENTFAKTDLNKKTVSKKAAEVIKVDREAWSVFNFLWLLVPAAVLYYVWKNRVTIGKKITGIWWV